MTASNPPRPTDAELEILSVLWGRGPSTVRDVHDVIVERRPAQYTTTLKQLQIMADKGLVRRNVKQRAHIYEAAVPREQTQRQLAGDLIDRAFGGSAKSLLLGALSSHQATADELAEIRKVLDEHEAKLKESGRKKL
ncbi:MAG: BlaI/MecI/CopY family transcriptional regulator [Acidobacteria bacterium]|nr:BlaI/MecI/CopY family transcriptional regulator [Acidobacteriota bacterium]